MAVSRRKTAAHRKLLDIEKEFLAFLKALVKKDIKYLAYYLNATMTLWLVNDYLKGRRDLNEVRENMAGSVLENVCITAMLPLVAIDEMTGLEIDVGLGKVSFFGPLKRPLRRNIHHILDRAIDDWHLSHDDATFPYWEVKPSYRLLIGLMLAILPIAAMEGMAAFAQMVSGIAQGIGGAVPG